MLIFKTFVTSLIIVLLPVPDPYSMIIFSGSVDVVDLVSSKIVLGQVIHIYEMSHSIFNIHVATSRFPIQRLLAWHISTCNSYSSRGCQGLPRHTIMCNSLGSTWKSRSDSGEHWKGAPHSGEHWKGAPPFVSRQCFPNIG